MLSVAVACVVLLFSLSLFVGTSYGAEVALMGPQPFLRTAGQTNVYSATFLGRPGAGTLLIQNGNPQNQIRVIAQVFVNETQVVRWRDFNGLYTSKTVPITLARNNTISVELYGQPEAYLTVTVVEEIACTALDQCHVAGIWDRTLGDCSNPAAPNGVTCNDGNGCTQTDSCQSGVCVGTNPVVCQAMDQCHLPGVCNPANGMCSNPAAPNGVTCSDGNYCTQTDTCQSDACVGTNPVVCQAMDQCHLPGVCNPANGVCSDPIKPDFTSCNDGSQCTRNDFCYSGVCEGTRISCDDENFCTADTCDPLVGCIHTEQRKAIEISPSLTRYSLTSPEGRVSLFADRTCGRALDISAWLGWFFQSMEPEINYCGPTAGMNQLEWFGVPSTYEHLGTQMNTNEWTDTEIIIACLGDPICIAALDYLINVGTAPEDMKKTLAEHSPPGYQLSWHEGNPGLATFEAWLAEGNPITVLIWTGSSLHWTNIIGTYEDNGTPMVRFDNYMYDAPYFYTSESWDTFSMHWGFESLFGPTRTILSWHGIDNNLWMRYEKTTMLTADQMIVVGQENALYSQDGRFMFFLDTAGHLVLYPTPLEVGSVALWHSNNAVISNAVAAWMQSDGNLVIRDENMNPVWTSNTRNHPGAYLAIQNDGNLVIYDADHRTVLWSSNTCCH